MTITSRMIIGIAAIEFAIVFVADPALAQFNDKASALKWEKLDYGSQPEQTPKARAGARDENPTSGKMHEADRDFKQEQEYLKFENY